LHFPVVTANRLSFWADPFRPPRDNRDVSGRVQARPGARPAPSQPTIQHKEWRCQTAERTRARAIRRCGELLQAIKAAEGSGAPNVRGGVAPEVSRSRAARDAGNLTARSCRNHPVAMARPSSTMAPVRMMLHPSSRSGQVNGFLAARASTGPPGRSTRGLSLSARLSWRPRRRGSLRPSRRSPRSCGLHNLPGPPGGSAAGA